MSELRADARRTDDGGKPWGLWSSVGFGVLMVAVWVLVQGLLAVILVGGGARQGDVPAEGWIVARATIAGAPILVGAPVLLARMRQGISVEGYLGLVWPRAPQALRWSLVLLGFIAASDSLSWALGRPLVPESMLVVFRTAGFLPIFLFALIVAAPLAEEFLFRGFLFAGFLHSRLGPPGTIALTALAWAALHVQYDWYGMATVAAGGLLLGWIRWRTGSLWLCALLHGLMNIVAAVEVMLLL